MAAHIPLDPPAALSLALAVIASSNAPLVLLDGDLGVVAASHSFCRSFQLDPSRVVGRSLFSLGEGEWDVPSLRSLLNATLVGLADTPVCDMELGRGDQPPRHLALNARRLDYVDRDNIRLLLAVTDITDARASEKRKDDLLREQATLLQELQHRVANSLQIIASLLLQSARRVQSDEARGHLRDAHQRVMSVAAIQRQLAVSRLGDVELKTYFSDLCASISASMIHDPKALSLDVDADNSVIGAQSSVSLGLIVTELVINTLKHAFPDQRSGRIIVGYRSRASGWTLSVGDDGVGMPEDPSEIRLGLGTSIVSALANQLQATVQIARANPGTTVSVVHALGGGAA